MNPFLAFALAVVALLAVPGPTNTLLATSGATTGFRRSLGLVPAEIGGYGVAIGVLLTVIGPLAAAHPMVPVVSKLVASLYLLWSAVVLWRSTASAATSAPAAITFRRVFVTTLLNPKALIFAFVIFPRGDAAVLVPFALVFLLLVVAVAIGWIALGVLLARSGGSFVTPFRVTRGAALALGLFATLIGGAAIAAALG